LVVRVRRTAGLFVAPLFHGHITALHARDTELDARIYDLEQHMPSVLNAISSVNGTSRLLRRELHQTAESLGRLGPEVEALSAKVDARTIEVDDHLARLDGHVRDELWPMQAEVAGLVEARSTVEWLIRRVEEVRSEMMFELRYGGSRPPGDAPAPRILNSAALDGDSGVRINLGSGLVPLEGYVNVDMRELPGVDVVAPVDDLPFEPESLAEISSAHTLEHFPQEQLTRQLLPYWYSLLAPGGTFRAVVPDLGSMLEQLQRGDISFEAFRLVAYGGQEYEGDFHHNAFTPDSLRSLLEGAGFDDVRLVERGRVNGDCLEFEMTARRPT
jgi:hypothetical protein